MNAPVAAAGGGAFFLAVMADDALLHINAARFGNGNQQPDRLDKVDVDAPVQVPGGVVRIITVNNPGDVDNMHVGAVTDSAADTLELSAAEIAQITAATLHLRIQGSDSSTATISAAIAPANVTNLELIISITGQMVFQAGGSLTVPGLVKLEGGNISTDASGVDVAASSALFQRHRPDRQRSQSASFLGRKPPLADVRYRSVPA